MSQWTDSPDPEDVEQLPGAVGGAWRVGRTVRRPTGPWTPAVHDLLRWLADQGLGGIPHVHGIDDDGREVLSFIEGRGVPVDREIVLDTVLVQAVQWLREYHDLAESYRPAEPQIWRGTGGEPVTLAPDEIICHHDPGAYNWIIQSGQFVAMIDWDMAGPGKPIGDLAFLVWTAIPLYRDIGAEETARRLDLVVETYAEFGPMTLLDAVVARMTTASERIAAGIERGDEGIANLQKVGEPQRTRDRVAAFRERIPAILDALP